MPKFGSIEKYLCDKKAMEPNRWIKQLDDWCPAQLFYYFEDTDGEHWCIYLHWAGKCEDEPWTAELVRCNENWELLLFIPNTANLLEEKQHEPGIITGYFKDNEYPFLIEKCIAIVKERFPKVIFEITPYDKSLFPYYEQFIGYIDEAHRKISDWLNSNKMETASYNEQADFYDYLERTASKHSWLAIGRHSVCPGPDDFHNFPEEYYLKWKEIYDMILQIWDRTNHFAMLFEGNQHKCL